MDKQLIFIDDSGDPGFKGASSSRLIMAAALFTDSQEATTLSKEIDKFRNFLGWHDDYEFKFSKIRKDIIASLLDIIAKHNFQIYSVYIDKESFERAKYILNNEKLYNWLIKELLLSMPLYNAKIEIDGSSSKQYQHRTSAYLRKALKNSQKGKCTIKFVDSRKDNLIQLADVIVGSVNRSMTNKTDANAYLNKLKNKIRVLKQIN